MPKRRLLLPLMLMTSQVLLAQLPQYHAQVFGAANGITGGNIASLFQDQQQFLWVAAGNALQRFDGTNVKQQGFEDNISQAICDSKNRIWVLEAGKVWRSVKAHWGFELLPLDSSKVGSVRLIFQMQGRPVSLLTSKGLLGWDEKTASFYPIPMKFPPPAFTPGSMRFDTCGTTLFYPGDSCLYAADLATGRVSILPVTTPFATMCAFSADLIALSLYNGLTYWMDFKKGTSTPADAITYGLSNKQHYLNIQDALPIGNNLFLVATRFGVCTYDLRLDRFTRQRIFAEGRPIDFDGQLVRLFSEESGKVWAHDRTNIIEFTSLKSSIGLLRNYHDEPPLKWSSQVVGITEDEGGNIWFGGFNGFNKLDPVTGKVETHPSMEEAEDRLSHPSVRGMGCDGKYIVVGPTGKGLWLYEPGTDRYHRPHYASESVATAMSGEFISGILPLRNGDFVVCAKNGTYRLRKQSHLLELLAFPGSRTNVVGAYQDAAGRIWLGSTWGVHVLEEQGGFLFSIPFEKEVVRSIAPDGEGGMLLGTYHGLFRLSPADKTGRIEQLKTPIGNSPIALIFQDQRKRFWFGTSDGLFLADEKLRLFRRFDFADNIQGLVYHPFAMLRASSGMMFLGGQNGINYFYPENIEMETEPLAVTLQTLSIGGHAIWNPHPHLVFSHDKNTLSVEAVVPYYNNAGNLKYRYRLSADGEWVDNAASNIVQLAELPSGKYQFELAASIVGSKWYAAPAFSFRIRPALWQTPGFLVSMLFLAVGIVYFFLRKREKQLKARQLQALELERLKTTAFQARLQSLRLQMNPHFLFNSLNSIQELILTGNSEGAATYLSKFSKLLRMVLAHSEHEMVSLREEIGMLRLYLELESLRFADTFEYQLTHDPNLDLDDYQLPTLLIQPFVENAIWHGLLHKEGLRKLQIHFETDKTDHLVCLIEDNGVGRNMAPKRTMKSRDGGRGIRAGRERLEAINSRTQQQNSLEIMDLVAADGTAIGTKVRIELA